MVTGVGFVIWRSRFEILLPATRQILCLVVPDSTPPRFVKSPLVSLTPAGSFNKFLFNLQYFFRFSVQPNADSSAKHFDTEIK